MGVSAALVFPYRNPEAPLQVAVPTPTKVLDQESRRGVLQKGLLTELRRSLHQRMLHVLFRGIDFPFPLVDRARQPEYFWICA